MEYTTSIFNFQTGANPLFSNANNPFRQWLTVALFFFTVGFICGAWASRIPLLKSQLDISEGELGVLLLLLAAGGVIAMTATPTLLSRFKPRTISTTLGLIISFMFILPFMAQNFYTAAIVIFCFGACNGSINVASNADAAETEFNLSRNWMSGFHGIFSIGGLIGAGVSSLLFFDDVHSLIPVFILSAISFSLFLSTALTKSTEKRRQEEATETDQHDFSASLYVLAAIAFVCLVTEGAMADWSALLMRESGASERMSSFGYGAFAAGMASLRFSGDWLAKRFGQINILRFGALVATAGLSCALVTMQPYAILLGYLIVGAGLANVIPVLFRLAART
ncbi:MFS transporter, partial [bacterium]|nr:MFS transporter [bacterium]